MTTPDDSITPQKFLDELRRYRNGSVTRRHFLGVTGLGAATVLLGGGVGPRKAYGGTEPRTLNLIAEPNSFAPQLLDDFTAKTGIRINTTLRRSSEDMLAALQADRTGWDAVVTGSEAISALRQLDLIEPVDLKLLPNYDAGAQDPRFAGLDALDGVTYAALRSWGTTGFVVNAAMTPPATLTTWKSFWGAAQGEFSGKVTVQDNQLTAIGHALKSFGHSFNSLNEKELADAEMLLLAIKPHLLTITSDCQPAMRSGDAAMAMCWSSDAAQLHQDNAEMTYVLGKEGGEIRVELCGVAKGSPNRDAAYAFVDYVLTPEINARNGLAHGAPCTDRRCARLLPQSHLDNPILYPAKEALDPLEFAAAEALTSTVRAEIMARFKAA